MNYVKIFKQGIAVLFLTGALLWMSGCARNVTFVSELREDTEETTEPTEAKDALILAEETPEPEKEALSMIYVDVCGAVNLPGVYKLPSDARVYQAIDLAGGFREDAAGEYVNRAGTLADAQQLYIPTRDEIASQDSGSFAHAPAFSAGTEGGDGSGGKININQADANALCTLTGIGASKAAAIIEYREQNGVFSSVEDILKVPGIGEGTLAKFRDQITV